MGIRDTAKMINQARKAKSMLKDVVATSEKEGVTVTLNGVYDLEIEFSEETVADSGFGKKLAKEIQQAYKDGRKGLEKMMQDDMKEMMNITDLLKGGNPMRAMSELQKARNAIQSKEIEGFSKSNQTVVIVNGLNDMQIDFTDELFADSLDIKEQVIAGLEAAYAEAKMTVEQALAQQMQQGDLDLDALTGMFN